MKLLFIMQCYPTSSHVTSLWGKQSHHPVLKHHQSIILGVCILLRVISDDVGFNPSTQRIRCQLRSPKVVIYLSS
jgi:hypothetical protein